MPARRTLLAAALLLAAGCSYTYRNPVEDLAPGEIGGRAVAASSAVLDGVAVSVKGAGIDARSRTNGRFAVLPLPVGRHTLVLRKGKDRAVQRQVEIALGKDGQPQGVWLGDVEVPAAVALAGECAIPGGVALAAGGLAVDEASGQSATVSAAGRFLLTGLAVGPHRIRVVASDGAGNRYVAGPVDVTFSRADAGSQKTLTRLALRPPAPTPSPVVFRLGVIGSGVSVADLTVTGLGQTVRLGADGTARVDVAEGPWTVYVQAPQGRAVTAPEPVSFVAAGGATIDLGTLYAVSDAAVTRNALACHADADCAPRGTCGGDHLCRGYSPPASLPASVPLCDGTTLGCQIGPIGAGTTAAMTCVPAGGVTVGVACGTSCTPDGVYLATTAPNEGGCPPVPAQPTGTVSGRVTGAIQAEISVSLAGIASLSTATDPNGNFTFTGVTDGTYEVFPSAPGFAFTPPSRQVTVRGDDHPGQDFVAAVPSSTTHTVSGSVLTAQSTPLPGVTVTLASPGVPDLTTQTDATGAWRFTNVPAGPCTITLALAGWTLSPPSYQLNLVVDLPGLVSVGYRSFTLSGNAGGGAGVLVVATSPSDRNVAVTDATGAWSIPGLQAGTYTVTPSQPGLSFTPADRAVTASTGDVAGLDFVAAPGPATACGTSTLMPISWCWEAPGLGFDLRGLWGSAANDVWAVGAVPLRWNGNAWTWSPTSTGLWSLDGVFGTGPSDVWAFGSSSSMVDHFTGASWSLVAVTSAFPNGQPTYTAGWAWPTGEAWVVGTAGGAMLWNGVDWWAPFDTLTTANLNAVWGSSLSDVWAVGDQGTAVHFDGVGWSTVDTGTTANLESVWVSSTTNAWAVGGAGTMLRWNGTAWSPQGVATTTRFRAVWGSGPGDVWAGGDGGVLVRWNGASWSPVQSGTSHAIQRIWGSGANDVWALADRLLLRWNGTAWSPFTSGTSRGVLHAVAGASATDLVAVGSIDGKSYSHHWNGSAWTSALIDTGLLAETFVAVWAAAPNDAWAVGQLGSLARWNGTAWTVSTARAGTVMLNGIWGASATNAWAVGIDLAASTGAILHWDGALWTTALTTPVAQLYGVWGSSATDVWAVGRDTGDGAAAALHFDGTSWSSIAPARGTGALRAVWGAASGDVWAVGEPSGNANNDNFAQHWDGSAWTTAYAAISVSSTALVGISGTAANDVWALGSNEMTHYDGTRWNGYPFVSSPLLYGVWASPGGRLWAVGNVDTTDGVAYGLILWR